MLTKLGKCALAGLLSVCTVLTAAPAMASAVRAADEAVVIDDTEFAYSAGKNANDGGWDSAAGGGCRGERTLVKYSGSLG